MPITVTNFMEVCVVEFMDDVLKSYPDICKCDKCRSDIAALALNHLPPKYTTSDIGNLYSKASILDNQYRTDVFSAIVSSIECVKKNPRHPEPVQAD